MSGARALARRLAVPPLLALPLAAAAAEPCGARLGAGVERAESARYVVAFRPAPAPIAVGRAFALDAEVCPKRAAPRPTGLRVDAHMPEHRHGMNYRATVASAGGARYRAEGLLFHMPGRWQIVFDVEAGAEVERAVRDVPLE
ncbi:MAG: hypothetical protein KJ025_02300 [Burkholderiales bacterium]|nr:hypothetical protein [Burkholderiales bacterium]